MKRTPGRPGRLIVPLLLAGVIAYLFATTFRSAAAMPDAFADAASLEQATEQSRESGRPVLVFATADWCGPCQRLKRTTLANEQVNEAIKRLTEPVYLDLTNQQANPEAAEAARRMGVQGIPALILLRDGQVISHRSGGIAIADMLSWLEEHG